MNKNNIVELALREIKELEILVNGLVSLEQIPDVMFQLSDAKVDNIKKILNLLSEENVIQSTIEPVAVQKDEKVTEENTVQEEKNEIKVELVEVEKEDIDIPEDIQIPVFTENEIIIEPVIIEEKEVEVQQKSQVIVAEERIKTVIEEIIPEKEPVIERKTERIEKKTIIGEKIIEKKSSVNEKLSEKANNSLDKTLINKKIADLKKSINLNDKFRFQKELFKGNASLLNQTLDVLNEREDKNEAIEFLSSFEWNPEDPTVLDFMELVNRKFM